MKASKINVIQGRLRLRIWVSVQTWIYCTCQPRRIFRADKLALKVFPTLSRQIWKASVERAFLSISYNECIKGGVFLGSIRVLSWKHIHWTLDIIISNFWSSTFDMAILFWPQCVKYEDFDTSVSGIVSSSLSCVILEIRMPDVQYPSNSTLIYLLSDIFHGFVVLCLVVIILTVLSGLMWFIYPYSRWLLR